MTMEATFRGKITLEPEGSLAAMEAVFDALTELLFGADDILTDVGTSGSIASGDFEVTFTLDVP